MSYTVEVYIGGDQYMTFDQETLEDLIDANNKAIIDEETEFKFQDKVFLTSFAGQVIEYVKRKLP